MVQQTAESILRDIKKELDKPANKYSDENLIEHIARLYERLGGNTELKKDIASHIKKSLITAKPPMSVNDYQRLLEVLDTKGGSLINYNVLDKGASFRSLVETTIPALKAPADLKAGAADISLSEAVARAELRAQAESMKELCMKYANRSVKSKEKFFEKHAAEINQLRQALMKEGMSAENESMLRVLKDNISVPILINHANHLINKLEKMVESGTIDDKSMKKFHQKMLYLIDQIGESRSTDQDKLAERFGTIMVRAHESRKKPAYSKEELKEINALADQIYKMAIQPTPQQPTIRENQWSSHTKEKTPATKLNLKAAQEKVAKGKESVSAPESSEESPVTSPKGLGRSG